VRCADTGLSCLLERRERNSMKNTVKKCFKLSYEEYNRQFE
jgi:hypothetical protein